MALINCPECGHEMSDTAKKCPNCGYSLESEEQITQTSKSPRWLIVLAVVLFVLATLCIIIPVTIITDDADFRRYGYVESFGTVVSNCLIYLSASILFLFFAFYFIKKVINSSLKGFWIVSGIVVLCFGVFWIFKANDTKLMNAINQQEEIEKYAGKERTVKNTFLGVELGMPINEAVNILQNKGYNIKEKDRGKRYEITNKSDLPDEMREFAIICYNDRVYEIELTFDKDVAQSISDKYPVEKHQYLDISFSTSYGYYDPKASYETGTHYDDGNTTVKIEGNLVRYIDDNLNQIKADAENAEKDKRSRDANAAAADY